MKWYQDPMTLATVVVAVAAVLNLLASFLMWKATANSARTARDIFEATYRPRVGIVGVQTSLDPHGEKVKLNVTLKNYGSLPAAHLKLLCLVETTEADLVWGGQPIMPQETAALTCKLGGSESYRHFTRGDVLVFKLEYMGSGRTYTSAQAMRFQDNQLKPCVGVTT
ncbi:MAG TPA: hypothetical protein VGV59_08750 [Pyrinomonadaceae bacterium]|nr:hypothetical protein [Pyrinomonadaceae bacterium]